MENFITRAEHEEFCKRIEQTDYRQDTRIKSLESDVRTTLLLAESVKTLADNMDRMLEEQRKQGERLETLEGRDGEMWRKAITYIVTSIISIAIGVIATKIGL